MSWKSWIARGAGYALAPWTGGASIGVGEGIAEGLDATDAAKKANQQQQTATTQAQGYLAPYANTGLQAENTLAGLMGFSPLPTTPNANAGAAAAAQPAPSLRQPSANAVMTGRTAQPRTLAEMSGPIAAQQQVSQSSYGGGTGESVPIRNPQDGKVYLVPRQHVQAATTAGGQVVQA